MYYKLSHFNILILVPDVLGNELNPLQRHLHLRAVGQADA
jgi:hypothetical protein